jgi:hypothetical protein
MANDDGNRSHDDDDAVERYRQAADDALQQLDWCIGYLHGIKKGKISRALAHNRSVIRTSLLHRPEQPLPPAQTTER